MQLIYEGNVARISLDETVPCLVYQWVGRAGSRADFREAMAHWLSGLYTLRARVSDHRPLGVLVNNMQARFIDPADQEWITENINPRQLEAGLGFVAIVDDGSQESTRNVAEWKMRVEMAHQPFVSAIFRNEEEARSWLREVVRG